MKMVFVDAENIGLKALETIKASVIDKVFVFSKSEPIKQYCENALFLYLSGYPSGSNQADFYIISYLSKILFSLDKKQFSVVEFELYSNDKSLILAYEFLCSQVGVTFRVIQTKKEEKTKITAIPTKKPPPLKSQIAKEKIYQSLKIPTALDLSFQNKMGLSKSDFSKAISALIQSNKITRSTENKKKWVRC